MQRATLISQQFEDAAPGVCALHSSSWSVEIDPSLVDYLVSIELADVSCLTLFIKL